MLSQTLKLIIDVRNLLQIGFPQGESGGQGREEVLGPLLDAMSQFRLNVRSATQEKDTAAVLSTCDHVRDVILPELGVRLEVGWPIRLELPEGM